MSNASKKGTKTSLPKKQLLFLMNMIENQFYEENLIRCDLSPYETIYADGNLSVRHYFPLTEDSIMLDGTAIPVSEKRHRTPIVLVPPLGATAVNFDLFPDRSIVRYLMAMGFDVYLIDWGEVSRREVEQGIEHYIGVWYANSLAAIREHSGKRKVSLVGYCMGGLLSLMHTAYNNDKNIKNIVTIVSPLNWYESGAAGQLIQLANKKAKIISYLLKISPEKLPSSTFHIPGWALTIIFKMSDPVGSLVSYWDGLINMWDRDFLIRRKTMEQWFNKMEDYSGAMVRDVLTHYMHDNKLASGKVKLGDGEADLSSIKIPLLSFGGKSDNIVSVKSARHIMELVSSEDKEFHVVPGGHAGAFAGKKAFENTWPITAEWLSKRSG